MTTHVPPVTMLAEAAVCVAAADLFTGAVHWLEDTYGRETWPVVGKRIIAPNRLHHERPRAFLANSWWQSSNLQMMAGVVIALALFAAGALGWQAVLFLVVAVNANEIHKWAHRTPSENPSWIQTLQRLHLVQSRGHHGRHHGGLRNSRYCVVTPWLNYVLDACGVWRALERTISLLTGAAPHLDPAVAHRLEARA